MTNILNDSTSNGKSEERLIKAYTTSSGRVHILTLSRPRALNAVSREMASQLFSALREANENEQVRVVLITGTGQAFSAGADIKELQHMTTEDALHEDWLGEWNRAFLNFKKPLVCAINGYAFGGGAEIAMMCDILHCSKSMQFGLPEITLGTIPGAGGTQRLIQEIGKSRAFEMILTGERIGAEEAYRRGLVSRVFEDSALLEESTAFAETIAKQSSISLQMAKRAISQSQKSVIAGLKLEKILYHMTFDTSSFKEGIQAFLEKRSPDFS